MLTFSFTLRNAMIAAATALVWAFKPQCTRSSAHVRSCGERIRCRTPERPRASRGYSTKVYARLLRRLFTSRSTSVR